MTGSDATSELESNLAEVAVALFAPGTLEATLQNIVTLAVATVDGCDAAGVFLAEDGQVITAASPDHAGPAWAGLPVRLEAERLWRAQVIQNINEAVVLDVAGREALEQIARLQLPPESSRLYDLGLAGIDFSVTEEELTEWLDNPEFTPYPAHAEALLSLLARDRLRQPVYLDVIAFNYENTPGAASPRTVDQVDLSILKAAVLDGWNTRYGEAVGDLTSLLVPRGQG